MCSERDRTSTIQNKQQNYVIPSYFVSIANHEKAFEYLKRNNCLEAYYDRVVDIKYDPRANRVVFMASRRSDGVCVDAVGRTLTKGEFPKWYRYNSSDYPFIVGEYETAILVEDAASACSVYAAGYTGVALMGTNLKSTYLADLKSFKECVIALDPDAARKSLKMVGALSPYIKTRAVLIPNDLKYYNKEEIREIIK